MSRPVVEFDVFPRATIKGRANGRALTPIALLRYVTCNAPVAMTDLPMTTRTPSSKPRETRERVRDHRARMRAAGLRPIQIWVPDTRSEAFRAQAHHQSLAVARSSDADLDQAFIDAVTDNRTE